MREIETYIISAKVYLKQAQLETSSMTTHKKISYFSTSFKLQNVFRFRLFLPQLCYIF